MYRTEISIADGKNKFMVTRERGGEQIGILGLTYTHFVAVQSVVSDSLQPHGLQHMRLH